MGKPILFDTISRAKFDNLTDEVKGKRNYQIKEEDGTISKHIAGLEGVGGGLITFVISSSMTVNTIEEIDKAFETNPIRFELMTSGSFNYYAQIQATISGSGYGPDPSQTTRGYGLYVPTLSSEQPYELQGLFQDSDGKHYKIVEF